jgi:LysM repeat protein
VKTSNPFVPTVSLITLPSRNQRERFKMWFFTVLSAHVALFVVLLLKDYREEFTVNARSLPEVAGSSAAQSTIIPVVAPKPDTASPPLSSTPIETGSTPLVSRLNATATTEAAAAHPDAFYVVKSGDTLSQIAVLYGTSVKAIKTANSLGSERLAVGQKLKVRGSLVSTTFSPPAMTGSL